MFLLHVLHITNSLSTHINSYQFNGWLTCIRIRYTTTSISSFAQATGSALCTFVNATSTLLFSLFIGYYFGWKLALVVTLFMPLLILVGVLQVQMMAGYAQGGQRAVEQGGKVSGSARSNLFVQLCCDV